MKFAIDAVILFSNVGARRNIEFVRNGVNVITGGSNTGKTAILDIIDYCFLASKHRLPDSVINENVSWYALKLYINEKEFILARRSPIENHVSRDYFFSQLSELQSVPSHNIAEDDLRRILETEFGIDDRVIVPFGGRALRAGAKLSFRYFFLFNTVSQDIITNSEVFFDKQTEERYREALPRIFDLALGIDDLENIAARERKEELIRELARLTRKEASLASRREGFDSETKEILRKAAAFGLVDGNDANLSIAALRQEIETAVAESAISWSKRYEEVSSKLFLVNRRIRSIGRFTQEYSLYKATLRNAEDSLKPLDVILEKSSELVKTDAFDDLISGLKTDLLQVKRAVATKQPVDGQIAEMVRALKADKSALEAELAGLPESPTAFESARDRWLFIGETRGKLNAYFEAELPIPRTANDEIERLNTQIDAIKVRDVEERREMIVRTIEEIALALLQEVKFSLENYAEYQTVFNYKEKKLQLRKPRSSLLENVGSSSNHMFLHLFHFLALHEVAVNYKSRFIPSFLVLDLPSRPYYGEEKVLDEKKLSHSDTAKISAAFKLLNNFVTRMNTDYATDFQMIVFEHVPTSIFEEMRNVHLIEEFRDGIALIPANWTERVLND
ncbi:MAG: DUF3732 domain-containing protein [Chitinophagaceae bacterium]